MSDPAISGQGGSQGARKRQARPHRPLGPLAFAVYLGLALLFSALYFSLTIPWKPEAFQSFISLSPDYPLSHPVFRSRVLMPLLGYLVVRSTGADPSWAVRGLSVLAVFGSLVAYRQYLARFITSTAATILAAALMYPLVWNYCLLNRLYFPFDMPCVLFAILGYHFIHTRNWRAYYPTLFLAILNRDTAAILIVACGVCLFRTIPAVRLGTHLLAQGLLFVLVKYVLVLSLGTESAVLGFGHLSFNAQWIRDMLLLRDHGPKDWLKLLTAFGGSWLMLPWVQGVPEFLVRSLALVVIMVGAVALMGQLHEVRVYGELVPVIITPIIYKVAGFWGRARSAAADRTRD